ncbi:DUF86 domain-containing protein [bacterium]|nr:DUF86 domain-containing protein [bacterium]
MVNGIITRKLEHLDSVLAEVRSLGAVTALKLRRSWRLRRIVERELQVLVEIVIDVCQRILALRGATPPASGGDAIKRCIELGVLKPREAYGRMAGFRNIVVHRYENVDVEVLAGIVSRNLCAFTAFRNDVKNYVRRTRS